MKAYAGKCGTDKQIDWAERIVKGLISGAEKITSRGVENGSITEEEKEQILYSLENNITYQSDANWWIDTRDNPITDKLLEICDGDLEEIIKKLK